MDSKGNGWCGEMRRNKKFALTKFLIILLGIILFVYFAQKFDARQPIPIILLASCIILSEFIDVSLPQGESISVSSAFVIFSLLIFKLPQVLVIAGLGMLIAALIKQKHFNLAGILLPVAKISLQAVTAASVYFWLGGRVGSGGWGDLRILPLTGILISYFLSKLILNQLFASRKSMVPFIPGLIGTARLLGPTYVALACTGILMVLIYRVMNFWGIFLFFLPLLVTRHSFKLYVDIKRTYQNTISALASAIETQNPRRKGHARRVARYAIDIARELGLRGEQLELVGYSALLHDIGKLGREEGELDAFLEDDQIGFTNGDVVHAVKGAEILEQVDYLKGISEVIRKHHAPYVRTKNQEGRKIPLAARIINVASYYDDLMHVQEDDEKVTPRQAVIELKKEQGIRFDPRVVRAFTNVLRRQGKLVILF